jgi:trk system potassium uptake protein TrkA
MIACQIAYTLFHTPTKIARVRAAAYLTRPELFENEHIPVPALCPRAGNNSESD